MKSFYLASLIISIFPSIVFSQETADSAALKVLNRIDSMIQIRQFNNSDQNIHEKITEHSQSNSSIVYEFRIEQLNKLSAIRLDYNADVQVYIDKFIIERKTQVSRMLGLKDMYFPVFEEYLSKYKLPIELKYLPVLESGLNPLAISSSGAVGLWQFKLNSGKQMGLEVNSFVDQRSDIYLSTDAACRYLSYLYDIFKDWHLALAAYNGGPGEVRNAIVRSGYKLDYWKIRQYMSEQARNYVPAFIASVYVINFAHEHGIKSQKPLCSYFQTDTLWIDEAVSFAQLSQSLKIDTAILRFLNPMYRIDIIPDTEQPNLLVLPSNKTTSFLKNENRIYSKQVKQTNYIDQLNNAGNTTGLKRGVYKVQKGDFLHKIAIEHACSVESICAWNNLTDKNLNVGQELIIWQKDSTKKK